MLFLMARKIVVESTVKIKNSMQVKVFRLMRRNDFFSNHVTSTYLTDFYLKLLGYVYAGMQHANECFCGASENATRHGKVADYECNYNCSGNTEEMCGGFYRCSLWKYGNFTIVPLARKHTAITL